MTTPRNRTLPLSATTGTSVSNWATRFGIAVDIDFLDREAEPLLGVLEHIERLVAAATLGAGVNGEGQVLGPRGRRQRRVSNEVMFSSG